ncbi:hypothetical protein ACH5RR_010436 [Cinchona calisaya]|uniref:Uncharacterized protein n=1 Tax=Cinchona calisaya TaxID=153742 RepID=A0ABD3AIY5_9GENT
MGVSTREKGVLKLVHPGRHVEVHKEPITAAEIMSKYPRHCIARPDVFKFPYIVVRPESILLPGKVFYLVPNRTLYNLLKARGQRTQSSLRENQLPQNHGHHYYTRQHDRGHRRRLGSILRNRTNSHDQDSENYHSDTSYVDAWTEISDRIRKAPNKSYQASPPDSSIDRCRTFHGHDVTSTLSIVRSGGMQTRSSGDLAELKSCFGKQDSQRKFLNLKVTFASPIIIPGSPRGLSSPEQTV